MTTFKSLILIFFLTQCVHGQEKSLLKTPEKNEGKYARVYFISVENAVTFKLEILDKDKKLVSSRVGPPYKSSKEASIAAIDSIRKENYTLISNNYKFEIDCEQTGADTDINKYRFLIRIFEIKDGNTITIAGIFSAKKFCCESIAKDEAYALILDIYNSKNWDIYKKEEK